MLLKALSKKTNRKSPKFNGAPCAYFDGVYEYFNLNSQKFHAKFDGMNWNGPCVYNC